MQCPECGYMLSAFEKDCPRCKALEGRKPAGRTITLPPRQNAPTLPPPTVGAPQYHASLCPQCGAGLKPGLQLCTACGTKFPAPVAMPAPQMTQAGQAAQYPAYPPSPQQYPGQQAPQVVIYNNVAPQAPYPGYAPMGPDTIQMPPGSHNVAMAVIVALFLNGGGQFVNKQTGKGFVILLSAVVLGAVSLGIGWFVVSIFGLADAVTVANRLHRGEPVRPWQWF